MAGEPVAPHESLKTALRNGRIVDAARELNAIESTGTCSSDGGRIRRLEAIYNQSIQDLQVASGTGWTQDLVGDITYSYSLAGGKLRSVANATCNIDILRAVAGLLEYDLWMEFKPKIQSVEALGEWDPVDSLWHKVQTDCDNIDGVALVDALDEEVNAICISVCAPDGAEGSSLRGIALPPPATQKRETNWRLAFFFTPNRGAPGFRLTLTSCAELGTMATVLNWMPAVALRKFLNDDISQRVDGFLGHIRNSVQLTQRMEASDSPSSALYGELRNRIVQTAT